jgi:transglutaminase-like putative cysteine protease
MIYKIFQRMVLPTTKVQGDISCIVCLLPHSCDGQLVLEENLLIQPSPIELDLGVDYYGNKVNYLRLEKVNQAVSIVTESVIRLCKNSNKEHHYLTGKVHTAHERYLDGDLPFDVLPYLYSFPDQQTSSFVSECRHLLYGDLSVLDFCLWVLQNLRAWSVDFSVESSLRACLRVMALWRSVGLPCRLVRGAQVPAKLKTTHTETSEHYWCSVYDLQTGWFDIDPLKGELCDDSYIMIARGPSFKEIQWVHSSEGFDLGGLPHMKITIQKED